MGVSIRISGTLRDQMAVVHTVKLAEEFAEWKDWSIDRYVKAQDPDKENRHGIVLFPHEWCDPIQLVFDEELQIETEINTQFAGPETHIAIVDLLRNLSKQFDELKIGDDSGYWEHGDRERLEEMMDQTRAIIETLYADDPDGEIMFRRDDGRIIDFRNSDGELICVSRDAPDDEPDPIDIDMLRLDADAGDADAQFRLGVFHLTGEHVARNARTAVQYFEKAIEQGHLGAMNELAECFDAGAGVEQNEARAFELYKQAAEQGHGGAQSSLGYCYFSGTGTEQDEEQAIQWFRSSADAGDSYGQRMMGLCFEEGKIVSQDADEALRYFRQAAEGGDQVAQFHMGEAHRKGEGVEPQYLEAIRWYEMAAAQGHEQSQGRLRGEGDNEFLIEDDDAADFQDAAKAGQPHAQFRLAECFWQGDGVEPDNEMAYAWLLRAVEKNHAEAQFLLGVFYWRGVHVPEDHNEALVWFQRSAEQRHAPAMCRVGEWLIDKDAAGAYDPARAHDWFVQAAKQGSGDAYLSLGRCHQDGIETPVDLEKAAKCYQFAADQGLISGLMRLGECQLDGIGCEQNEQAAVEVLTRAADSDVCEAMNLVGMCHLQGRGVQRDEATAEKWFTRSANEGDAEAQFLLGSFFEVPRSRAPDFEAANHWYTEAAKQGHATAIASVGRCSFFGRGVKQDRSRAFQLFRQAAEKDDAQAQYWLGVCYEHGIETARSVKKAARHFDAAARQGHAIAQTKLAEFYLTGTAVAQNYDYAQRWLEFSTRHGNAMAMVMHCAMSQDDHEMLRRAISLGFAFEETNPDLPGEGIAPFEHFKKRADEGDARAMNNLAYCYLDGYGTLPDPQQAIECFSSASRHGLLTAQENLARCYQKGIGIEPDQEQAFALHQMAADRGDVRARYSLGLCYWFGRGTESDLESARLLIKKSAEAGHPRALLAMGEIIEATATSTRQLEDALRYHRRAMEHQIDEARVASRRVSTRLREDESYVPTAVIPDSLEDIGADLLPVVRPLSFFEFNRLRLRIQGAEGGDNWPYHEFAENLGVGLVYDLPRAMQHVMQEHLDQWGATLYESLERARDNLREMSDLEFTRINDQVFLCSISDDYDPSRILLADELRELPVQGKLVAMIPNVQHLFICGSDDDEGLMLMLQLASAAVEDSDVRTISRLAFCLHADGWSTWLPDESFDCYADYRRIWLQHHDQLYAEQLDLLDRLHAGEDLRIVKFMSRTDTSSNQIESFCQWPVGGEQEVYLPKTDFVQFVRSSNGDVEILGEATWEQVAESAGELLLEADEYPIRFRAPAYPQDGPFLEQDSSTQSSHADESGYHEELLVADDAQGVPEADFVRETAGKKDDVPSIQPATTSIDVDGFRQFKTTRCNVYGHAEFLLEVDPSDEQAVAGITTLLDRLESMVAEGSQFEVGQTFRYGWVILIIEQTGDGCLTMHEPDMKSWPIHYVRGVTNTIKHAHQQLAAVKSVSNLPSRPSSATMKQQVTVCNRIGETTDVFMQRNATKDPGHSGWTIECFDSHDHDETSAFDVVSLYEVFLREPLILDFLAFPQDTSVNLVDGKLNILEADTLEYAISPGSFLDTHYERAPEEDDDIDWDDLDDDDDLDGESDEADDLISKALPLFDKEEFEEVIGLLNQAIELNPTDGMAWHLRGMSYSELGQHESALSDLNKTIELDDSDVEYFNDRAAIHCALGRLDLAIADSEQALKISPDDHMANHNRAFYQKEAEQYDAALANFWRMAEDDPEDAGVWNEIACIMVSRNDEENRDPAGAVEFAERACDLSLWDDPYYLDTLAAAFAGSGQFDNAIKWQSKAVELAEEDDREGMEFRLNLYRNGESLRITGDFPFTS